MHNNNTHLSAETIEKEALNQPEVISKAQLLQTHCEELLGIEISAQRMLEDPDYFCIVINELEALNHSDLSDVLLDIKQLVSIPQSIKTQIEQPIAQTSASTDKNKQQKIVVKWSLVGVASLLLVVCFSMLWFVNAPDGESDPINLAMVTPQEIANKKRQRSTNLNQNPSTDVSPNKTATVAQPAELAFRLHGSNTIGEKLAPALLEGFLKTQGATNFEWLIGDQQVERVVRYSLDNRRYYIELHAHGSSTAFQSMANSVADMGMASRQIKLKELELLKGAFGDLGKIGNEHIIALDGLAVIVNQNNPVKGLTTKTLASIFAGEIKNWREVGGLDQPITVVARDKNSGTWDTFKNLVLKKYEKTLSNQAKRYESSTDLSHQIATNENAIGFIGLNYIQHAKPLSISEGQGTMPVYPTRFTIGTEDYALSRRLYFYTPTQASKLIKDFAHFAISEQGQNIVEKTGLISQNIKVEEVYPVVNAPAKYNHYVEQAQRLSLNFRFNYGNKELDNKGKRDLERLVSFMEDNKGKRLVLMGFSDSIGERAKNQKLSFYRASAVERELIARGIPVVAVEGFGEDLPLANNNIEAGRERNRRVEVWLL